MKISTLLLVCALGLSGAAAYYSIAGLATIFASAFYPVVAMASILEISKLVVASWLYQKWNSIPALLRIYLTSSVLILMFITSLGIFGFLSKAHVDAGLGNSSVNLKLEQINSEISQSNATTARYQVQLLQLDKAINIQLDANRASQAMTARKEQENERNNIRSKLDTESARLQDQLRQKTILREQLSVVESKIGPIKYIAEFFADGKDVDLDKAVRWMIVIIVIVFDPLAVLMLIAANISMVTAPTVSAVKESDTVLDTISNNGPTIGQTVSNNATGQMLWWTGTTWKDFAVPVVQPAIINQPILQQDPVIDTIENTIDAEMIKSVVTESMDLWLAKALSDLPASDTETRQSKIETTPAVITPDSQPIKPKGRPPKIELKADQIDKKIINTSISIDQTYPLPDLDPQRTSSDDGSHILDHFKPSHIPPYSKRV